MKRLLLSIACLAFLLAGCTSQVKEDSEEEYRLPEDCAELVVVTRKTKPIVNAESSNPMTMYPGKYLISDRRGDTLYLSLGQDGSCILLQDFKIIRWTAAQGHGYVKARKPTMLRAEPSDNGKILDEVVCERYYGEGYCDDFKCLGVSGDWYKIIYKGQEGYIRKLDAHWDLGMDGCPGCIR